MSTAATTTHTSISVGRATTTAQRPVSVTATSSTTVSTGGASFQQHLDRVNMAERCQPRPSSCAPATAATPERGGTIKQIHPHEHFRVTVQFERISRRDSCESMTDMLRDVRSLLQDIYDQLRGARAGRPRGGAQPTDYRANVVLQPVRSTGHCDRPAAPTPAQSCAPARPAPAERTFAVKDAAHPDAQSDAWVRVRGGLAAAPVTEGAKLDEGIRRISGFLDQVGDHVRAGGTFTDTQLQSIADEAIAIYYEAIRPTVSENDTGDFSQPGRDGVLDLGESTQCLAVQASIAAGEPTTTATPPSAPTAATAAPTAAAA